MSAADSPIKIECGSKFIKSWRLLDSNNDPIDLTGYTAVAKFRSSYNGEPGVSFIASVDTETSIVTIEMDADTTASLKRHRTGVYDVKLSSGGIPTRIIQGVATVSPEASRADEP